MTADRKEYVISNASIVAQLLRFGFVWLLLQFNISVVFVKIAPILTLIIRSLILRIYIKRNYPNVNYSVTPTTDLSVTSNRWDALLLQISINTSVSLPTIIISQVLGFKEANIYAVYSLVASAIISIVSALSSGIAPKMGLSLSQGKDIDSAYKIYDFIVSIVIAVVFSTMAVMLIPFINLYTSVVDDVNYIYPLYGVLISVWAALYSYRIPLTAIINAAGIYRENRINNIVNIIIQVGAGIVGALIFGISGVLVVMIIASIQRNIGFSFINSKKVLHKGVKSTLLYQLLIALVVVISGLISNLHLSNTDFSVMKWILMSIMVFIIEIIINGIIFAIVDFQAIKLLAKVMKVKKSS